MKNNKFWHWLSPIFMFCAFVYTSSAQNYIQLTDASGFIKPASVISELDKEANRLNSILALSGGETFKLYTYGYYVHSASSNTGFQEARACAINEAQNSDYFILIGTEYNNEGHFKRFDITFILPNSGQFSCFSEVRQVELKNILHREEINVEQSNAPYPSPERIVKAAADYFYLLKNCSNCATGNGDICFKSSFEGIDMKLTGLKFRKKSVTLAGNKTWPTGQYGIYDHVQKNIVIDGEEYHIPDQIYESKLQFEQGAIIGSPENEDTTMTADPIHGKVFIFKNENFDNNDWDNMQSEAITLDYVECWVLLKDRNNQYWLYSRFSFGPFNNEGQSTGAAKGENAGSRSVTLSPWGNALKALGNAAIDACTQALINRLTDEKINSWGTAFKSVSYMGAAWEGISSLLPWKKNKAASRIATALGKAIIVVIDKASKPGVYTAEEGLRDFLNAFGQSVLSQLIGEKLSGKIPAVMSGLTRFVGNSNNGTANKIIAKCFSTQLLNYGCFVGNTPVYTSLSSQKLIRDIALHDIVLSHGTINANNSADITILSTKLNIDILSKLNAVSFISKNGVHSCQLSLNDASLQEYDIRAIGDNAFLSIPEQGIEGIYTVTDIRKINPPKIPTDENLNDDFVFSAVTGIFVHTSDDVWKLTFDTGEEVDVTSMHPFMDSFSGMWRPVAWLKAGDVVKTKVGVVVLTGKEKLGGTHTVYNFTVDNTHNYLIGNSGFVVHNTCGDLDKLATKFLNNFNKSLKKQEITTWWAQGFPGFFKRGTFFERLMAKSSFYSGWELTHHSFKLVDFIKRSGGKLSVISMKTTNTSNVATWISNNRKHLEDLANGTIRDLPGSPVADIKQLDVFVKSSDWNESLRDIWALEITTQFKGISSVRFTTMEKALNIN